MSGVVCTAWRPLEKNTLRGFCTLRLVSTGLEIVDCSVHEKNGRRWVGLPAKPMLDRDGNVLRGDDGRVRYAKILSWSSREVGDKFSEAALAAIDRHVSDGAS